MLCLEEVSAVWPSAQQVMVSLPGGDKGQGQGNYWDGGVWGIRATSRGWCVVVWDSDVMSDPGRVETGGARHNARCFR